MSASEKIQIVQQAVGLIVQQPIAQLKTKLYLNFQNRGTPSHDLIKIQTLSGQLPTHEESLWVGIDGRAT